MKTAVSIPDELFKKAEKLARKQKKTRSRLVSDALAEYVASHTNDEITAALNRVWDGEENKIDSFVAEAARRTLRRSEW